jgi:alpha-ketoglutarate-dependent taurine dioxygenase
VESSPKAEAPQAKPRTFRDIRRKTVDVSAASLVKTRTVQPGQTLPLLVEPALPNVDLADWARGNQELVEASLLKHGAILFRGFGVGTPAAFEKAALALCPGLFAEYGDLPREGLSDKVYQSTPYPPDKHILFHNESSHLPRWPRKQFFACMTVAREGGETPILDCREVYRQMDPEIRDRFAARGLMYVRNFIDGMDVPWQDFFHTSDRAAVEESCRKEGMTCEWTGGNNLRIRQVSPAVVKHPRTGEMVFFNQVQLHHPYCLDAETRQSLRALFKEEDLPRNVSYGDGTPIEDAVMEKLGDLFWKLSVSFPWQQGDLIMVENMLVSHARNPYVGPRKIVVAMGEMVSLKDLQPVAANT